MANETPRSSSEGVDEGVWLDDGGYCSRLQSGLVCRVSAQANEREMNRRKRTAEIFGLLAVAENPQPPFVLICTIISTRSCGGIAGVLWSARCSAGRCTLDWTLKIERDKSIPKNGRLLTKLTNRGPRTALRPHIARETNAVDCSHTGEVPVQAWANSLLGKLHSSERKWMAESLQAKHPQPNT